MLAVLSEDGNVGFRSERLARRRRTAADQPLRAAHTLYDAFLRGGEQAGFALTPDHNGSKQEGLHVAQACISQGLRWSSARAYLSPAIGRPNLHVLKNTFVKRLVIEHGAVIGIEIAANGNSRVITCEREVILCAGAFNTPKLLMLSGVGDADELRKHGIEVVADVREVGRTLQHHPGVDVQDTTNDEEFAHFGTACIRAGQTALPRVERW